jgi:hypothetical protein
VLKNIQTNGEQAYVKVGLRYDDELQDELYRDWLRATSADGLYNYTNHKEKDMNQLQVVQVNNPDYTGEEGGQYVSILYCILMDAPTS